MYKIGKSALQSGLFKKNFSSFQQAKLPDLPYDYNALEPVISAQIMEVHHKKHHNTYVKSYNEAVESLLDASSKGDHTKILQLEKSIRFNGGGALNHSYFWTMLQPTNRGGGELPKQDSKFTKAIIQQYQSYDNFISQMNTLCLGVQGSGWGWLGFNPKTKQLELKDMPNQDPLAMTGLIPLLGIDVWEHAYYLQYKNERQTYLKEIWKIINWKNVEQRYINEIQE